MEAPQSRGLSFSFRNLQDELAHHLECGHSKSHGLTEVLTVAGVELEVCSAVVCTAEASAGVPGTVSLWRPVWWALPYF